MKFSSKLMELEEIILIMVTQKHKHGVKYFK